MKNLNVPTKYLIFLSLFLLISSFSINYKPLNQTYNLEEGDYILIKSSNIKDNFLRHQRWEGKISKIDSEAIHTLNFWDAVFIVEKGLANKNSEYISLRSVNKKNHYLRHKNGKVVISPKSGKTIFLQDATWRVTKGLSNESNVSLSTYPWKHLFLRHRNGKVIISNIKNNLDKKDSTWEIIPRNDLKNAVPVEPVVEKKELNKSEPQKTLCLSTEAETPENHTIEDVIKIKNKNIYIQNNPFGIKDKCRFDGVFFEGANGEYTFKEFGKHSIIPGTYRVKLTCRCSQWPATATSQAVNQKIKVCIKYN